MRILNKYRDQIPAGAVWVGRPTPVGNPYSHLKGTTAPYLVATREEAIQRYRRWLWNRIRKNDQKVLDFLETLNAESVLVCVCAPQSCHAEVIERAWWYYQTVKAARTQDQSIRASQAA